jgi:hypothetical protein
MCRIQLFPKMEKIGSAAEFVARLKFDRRRRRSSQLAADMKFDMGAPAPGTGTTWRHWYNLAVMVIFGNNGKNW